jgi:hypothetical protein
MYDRRSIFIFIYKCKGKKMTILSIGDISIFYFFSYLELLLPGIKFAFPEEITTLFSDYKVNNFHSSRRKPFYGASFFFSF